MVTYDEILNDIFPKNIVSDVMKQQQVPVNCGGQPWALSVYSWPWRAPVRRMWLASRLANSWFLSPQRGATSMSDGDCEVKRSSTMSGRRRRMYSVSRAMYSSGNTGGTGAWRILARARRVPFGLSASGVFSVGMWRWLICFLLFWLFPVSPGG